MRRVWAVDDSILHHLCSAVGSTQLPSTRKIHRRKKCVVQMDLMRNFFVQFVVAPLGRRRNVWINVSGLYGVCGCAELIWTELDENVFGFSLLEMHCRSQPNSPLTLFVSNRFESLYSSRKPNARIEKIGKFSTWSGWERKWIKKTNPVSVFCENRKK